MEVQNWNIQQYDSKQQRTCEVIVFAKPEFNGYVIHKLNCSPDQVVSTFIKTFTIEWPPEM